MATHAIGQGIMFKNFSEFIKAVFGFSVVLTGVVLLAMAIQGYYFSPIFKCTFAEYIPNKKMVTKTVKTRNVEICTNYRKGKTHSLIIEKECIRNCDVK